jgi:hypothetical protein
VRVLHVTDPRPPLVKTEGAQPAEPQPSAREAQSQARMRMSAQKQSDHGRRPRPWAEVLRAASFYLAYAVIRDWHGSASGDSQATVARSHGLAVLHLEQHLHLNIELSLQRYALHWRPLVVGLNCFYGSFHFLLTWSIFAGLLRWAPPATFRRARNALAISTGIALVGFFAYPTMPPRLVPAAFGYQDTLFTVGGLWSYNDGVLEHISDPFAAMPSLHIVWAGWCALALGRLASRRRTRLLLLLYPACTAVTVLITGTHWLFDILAGVAVLALGWWASCVWAAATAPQDALRSDIEPASQGM